MSGASTNKTMLNAQRNNYTCLCSLSFNIRKVKNIISLKLFITSKQLIKHRPYDMRI